MSEGGLEEELDQLNIDDNELYTAELDIRKHFLNVADKPSPDKNLNCRCTYYTRYR